MDEIKSENLLILASESLPRKEFPAFKNRPTILIQAQIINSGKVWERGFRVWRVLRWKVLVYDMNVFERRHASTSGAVVSQVHFLFGVHLVSFLPICYQSTQTMDPLQSDDARVRLG